MHLYITLDCLLYFELAETLKVSSLPSTYCESEDTDFVIKGTALDFHHAQ